MYVLKVNSNERAFVGESSSYSYEESVKYVLGDDVRKRYEKDFSSIDRREKIFREQKKNERRENFSSEREREREDLARAAAIKNFFAAIVVVPINFLFRFPFFPLLLLFQQAVCCTGKKNEKFGLNSASKRPH